MEENSDGYSSTEQLSTQTSYNDEGTSFDLAFNEFRENTQKTIQCISSTEEYSLVNTNEISPENVKNIVVGSYGTGLAPSSKNLGNTAALYTINNSSDTLVALNDADCNMEWSEATLSILSDYKDSDINNLTVDGFSNATTGYLTRATNVANQIANDVENNYAHPDKITFMVSGTGDFFANGKSNITQSDIDSLKETNSQFLFVSKTGEYTGKIGTDGNPGKLKDNAGEMKAESLLDDNNLGSSFKTLKENDIPTYIAGINIEAFNTIHPGTDKGEHQTVNFASQAYILNLQNNPELMNDEEFMSNFKKIVDITEVVSETYINEETGEEETIVKQEHTVDAYLNLFDWSGHEELAYTGNIISVDNTLSSDLYDISYSMGEAAGTISNDFSLSYDRKHDNNLLGNTTTTVPASLIDVNESLFSANANLTSKLTEDLKLIASAALTIYNMDSDLAQEANSLSDLSTSSGYDASLLDNFVSQLGNTEDYSKGLVDNLRKFDADGLFDSNIDQVRAENGISAGKITIYDLQELIGPNGSLMNELDSDIESANNELTGIYDCQGVLDKYEGEIWDIAGEKLGGYEEAMLLRLNIDYELKNAYAAAYKMITDYMDPYTELDDSQVEEIEAEIRHLEGLISINEDKINATKKEYWSYTFLGITYSGYKIVPLYSEATRAKFRAENEYYRNTIDTELKPLLEKLKGLKDIIAKAEKLIEDTVSGIIAEYDAQVSNISVGQSSEYIK